MLVYSQYASLVALQRSSHDWQLSQRFVSIVLVLGDADAVNIEQSLQKTPDDIQNRRILATYYGLNGDKTKRLQHALWFVENRPEAVGGCLYCKIAFQDSPLDSVETFEKARVIWLRHADLRTSEPQVMMNAAGFIVPFDPNLAERLYLQGRELEPRNRQWVEALADIYGKGVFTDGRFRPQTPPSPAMGDLPSRL